MKILNVLKKMFPKPVLPQKRYLVLIFLSLYPLLHMIVEHTQTEWDDKMLEAVKSVMLTTNSDTEQPIMQDDEPVIKYS